MEDTFDKYHEIKQELAEAVESEFNIILYGLNDIGKKRLVEKVLKKAGNNTIKIDCSHSEKMNSFVKQMAEELTKQGISSRWNSSLSTGIDIVGYLHENLAGVKMAYVVLYQAQKILENSQLVKKVMACLNLMKEKVRFIMIVNGYFHAEDEFWGVSLYEQMILPIYLPPPREERLRHILQKRRGELQTVPFFPTFFSIIYSSFSDHIASIGYYHYLIGILFEPYYSSWKKNNELEPKQLYTAYFKRCVAILLQNVYMPYNSLEDLGLKQNQIDEAKIEDLFMPKLSLKVYSKHTSLGLTYLESIFIIATFIGGLSPPSRDLSLFANKKKQGRKTSEKSEERKRIFKLQPKYVDIDRILAIADYFLSTVDEISYERRCLKHTTEFYGVLSSLERQGWLNKKINKQDPGCVKYGANIEPIIVTGLADEINISLHEYLNLNQLICNSFFLNWIKEESSFLEYLV